MVAQISLAIIAVFIFVMKLFFYISFQVAVPSKELILAGKDAAAEYDDLAESQDFQDDPE